MKKTMLVSVGSLALFLTAATTQAVSMRYLSLGGRYHAENSQLPELPYDKGDYSAMAAVQFHEGDAYWQLGVDYAWDGGSLDPNSDYVLTPQAHLMFKDRVFVGGVGILKSYMESKDGESEWSDLYYELTLGVALPVSDRVKLEARAVYPFADWGDLGEFDTSDLDYVATLNFKF